MTTTAFDRRAPLVALAASSAAALALPMPAFAQAVADRTLSDVRAENVGACTTLTVNFNIRVQVLSQFPESGGRELHIRLRPLDPTSASDLRESLRTPESVPALRSIAYEGDNPSGPVLSLFFTRDVRFETAAGGQPQQIVIRLADPGTGPLCGTAGAAGPATAAPVPGIAIPAGLYAVNLSSQSGERPPLSDAQVAAIGGRIVYETRFERDSQQWRRLRLGFFETREEADTARQALLAQFPDAWVVKVSADERAQGVAGRIETGAPAAAATPSGKVASEAEIAETARLVGEAEMAIKSGDNDRAIQLLTNALALPENPGTPRALELLGLTRERKGQLAHAQAEYEEYLRRYPSGEAADRVRQRLAAVKAPGTAAPPELRAASGGGRSANAWTWGARGSFSTFYFRDQSTTKFVDASRPDINAEADNTVNLNQLLNTGDITISGGNDRRQLQLRAAGAYTRDFRGGGRDIKSLTALYLDYQDSDLGTSIRAGRQTRNSAGVLGRFDGALLGWQADPSIRVNLVAGFPVLSSRQTHVLTSRWFYGASVDIGRKHDALQVTLYGFDQHARGGFIDRRSLGFEARFLKPRFNAFSIVDYDVKFKRLNLGLLSLNYSFPDNSNVSLTADYRQSPLLTTTNALIGQIDPVSMTPITEVQGLRPFFADSQIYQLARDRTLVAKSLTVSYSRPLTSKLQGNVDFTLTNTGGTPASGGVAALPASGTEYYYGAQVVGSGLVWGGDIYILGGRYSDTQRARTYTLDFTARVPVMAGLRVSPRLRYGYRSDKFSDATFRQIQPTMRINYYPMSHSEIEVEFGGNFSRQKATIGGALNTTSEKGYVLSAGFRIDF